jgi:putative ABC transport system substrate-binding protein
VQTTAQRFKQKVVVLNASTQQDIDAAFGALVQQRLEAALVSADALFVSSRHQLVGLAARYSIPAIYDLRDFVAVGG